MRFTQTFVFFAMVLSGCVAGGSKVDGATDTRQFAGETPYGDWTVAITDDATVMTFDGEDASLCLEAINGVDRQADIQEEHPELGKYEVDLRVIDRNGIPWIMGIGGDDYSDPQWGSDYEASLVETVDPADRAAHYVLFPWVSRALESVTETSRQLDLLRGLVQSQYLEMDADLGDGSQDTDEDTSGNSMEPPPPPSVTYNHYVYVYYSPIYWGWGDHSDSRALSKNSAGTTTYYDLFYGNHGRYYYESGMSYSCGNSWTGRASKTLAYSPYSGTDTSSGNVGGGCSTGYGAVLPIPGVSDDGKHVCNDDSYAQYGNVEYNSLSSWTTCGDNTLNSHVPVCSSI